MVTIPNPPSSSMRGIPGQRFDRVFFAAMVVLLAGCVFLGFAHTYYLAGTFQAHLASHVLHVHGAVFTLWIVLLLAQATLVSVHCVDMHRRLGIFGVFLAALIVIMGILAAGDSLARAGPRASSQILSFSITPFTDMLIFGLLAGAAFRLRNDSATHKRLILLATIAMMRAAIFRWPFAFVFHNQLRAILLSYVFVELLIVYDLLCLHRLHKATMWATGLMIAVQVVRVPLGETESWHQVARWFGSLGI